MYKYGDDKKREYLKWKKMREGQGCKPLTYLEWLDYEYKKRG